MEIKDLAGLSKPLTKLIDVCSKGLGYIAEPKLIRARADAKAYELETISKALVDNKRMIGSADISYNNGSIEVISNKIDLIEDNPQLIQNEIIVSKYIQEAKKRGNINNVLNFTISELENEIEVSSEELDNDWITRFFNTIEDISNDRLQILWAKILAGEIKESNTYSLRTLDMLRNISVKEAEIFCRVGELAFIEDTDCFILANDKLLKTMKIEFNDLLLLEDLSLLHHRTLSLSFEKSDIEQGINLTYSNQLIKIEGIGEVPTISFAIYKFTTLGGELLKLIEPQFNDIYFQEMLKNINIHDNIKVSISSL